MRTRGRTRTRGVLLLECLLALAVLVMSFMAILSIVSDASGAVLAAGRRQVALDLARSALAEIEAGISTPETLNGPVRGWEDPDGPANVGEEMPAERAGLLWELVIDSLPTEFDGLSLVTVTAEGRAPGTAEALAASARLSQLVRLVQAAGEGVGEADRLSEEALRGAERERSRFPTEPRPVTPGRRTRP